MARTVLKQNLFRCIQESYLSNDDETTVSEVEYQLGMKIMDITFEGNEQPQKNVY